jgi:L,D-peptidoglycan transpeptidase YkuD (ErfK/YbiS/YcfS/YnhG family)
MNLRRWRAFGIGLWAIPAGLAVATAVPYPSSAQDCPEVLKRATRLLVASTATPNDKSGRIRLYERASSSERWRIAGQGLPIVVGRNGLAWGWTATSLTRPGEPIKREGDKRTPAGIFGLGRPFGFGASRLPGYLRLQRGATFCVDDATSPYYGQIVSRARAGRGVTGEDMATIGLYRRGILVSYPPQAARRAGSCIFIHVWRRPTSGTLGCIATSENTVERLQAFVAGTPAAIAILPETASARFKHCLPQ